LPSVANCPGGGGITIYIIPFDHPPPHVHAYQAEDEVSLNIINSEVILDGGLSGKRLRKIQKWVHENKTKLFQRWHLAQAGNSFKPIEEC